MTTTQLKPRHLQADACFVCGGEPHANMASHEYWSNADARREFAAETRMERQGYVEARYVDEYIGR